MKVTIVTTTYNQEKYIGQAIEGFVMQKTNFPFKIVISNDKSTDKTLKVVQSYQEKYPDLIEIIDNEKNLGAMGNFINTLSNIKDTEYVALCDGDDFWIDENKLQKQVDFLDHNKDFNVCFHKAKLFYQEEQKTESIIPEGIKDVTDINDLIVQNYIIANSVMYRWKFNDRNLKEIFPEDIVPGDYYVHLLHAQDGKIKMIDEVMSCYRRHEEGMWWSNDNPDKEQFTLIYGRKFLNFYNAADQNMILPEKAFYEQRKDIIYNMIINYVKKDKIRDLAKDITSQKDKEMFNVCMKDIVNRNIWFLDLLVQREKEKEDIEEIEKIKNSRLWKLIRKIKSINRK